MHGTGLAHALRGVQLKHTDVAAFEVMGDYGINDAMPSLFSTPCPSKDKAQYYIGDEASAGPCPHPNIIPSKYSHRKTDACLKAA
ncbi:hypothetical protein NDU88_009303 [Pleurodeles waltl]|uniref:Uncharacterized protein n=1 Tax=Pleurodeles waltl TaxID=8319 RepID=A0AAV7RX71_PLEWA|nr:hypothetical protein NDU88_009303 [Pleurodeles waltl]